MPDESDRQYSCSVEWRLPNFYNIITASWLSAMYRCAGPLDGLIPPTWRQMRDSSISLQERAVRGREDGSLLPLLHCLHLITATQHSQSPFSLTALFPRTSHCKIWSHFWSFAKQNLPSSSNSNYWFNHRDSVEVCWPVLCCRSPAWCPPWWGQSRTASCWWGRAPRSPTAETPRLSCATRWSARTSGRNPLFRQSRLRSPFLLNGRGSSAIK